MIRELWRTLSGAASLIFDLNFLSSRFAQCTQVSVHRARMTKNKTRHEPEPWIVDLAVFRDLDDGHSVAGLERVSPCAGVEQVLGGDTALY
jgi:hypothetical protein